MVFRRDRRKNLPLFASILHVSNPELFRALARRCGPPPAAAPRHPGHAGGAARWWDTAHSRLVDAECPPRRKMFKSPHLQAGPDRLPLQRAGLRGLVTRVDEPGPVSRDSDAYATAPPRGRAARRASDAPALTFKDRDVSYAELWRDITAVAGGLRGLGLARGERVAVYLDKRIETVAAIFGTSAAGGVFVPVNPLLRPSRSRTSSATAPCGCW